jgi:hypothetical protein
MARLEMAAFALSPGSERGLGPATPDEGRRFRSDLHDFLKGHAWSVFSSEEYRAVGNSLTTADLSETSSCARLRQSDSPRDGTDYLLVSFAGTYGDGVFLVADQSKRSIGFSFAAQVSLFVSDAFALLPAKTANGTKIYFARMNKAGPLRAELCR